jgi:pimeloyl-ACP methyl ester carboxylesterase
MVFLPLQWSMFPGSRDKLNIPPTILIEILGVPCLQLLPSGLSEKNANKRPTILFFHGNGSDISTYVTKCRQLSNSTGMKVICPEYRGYGVHGKTNSDPYAIVSDMRRILRFLYSGMKIHVVGYSIGAAVACQVSYMEQEMVESLSLICPFYNLRTMISEKTKSSMLSQALTPEGTPFESSKWVSLLDKRIPLMITHGSEDSIIPFNQGQRLSDEKPGSVFILQIYKNHKNVSFSPIYNHLLGLRNKV